MRRSDILVKTVEAELLRADAQVAVLVEPDCERQPISDEEPLTNVKLAVVDQHRPLYATNTTTINTLLSLRPRHTHCKHAA